MSVKIIWYSFIFIYLLGGCSNKDSFYRPYHLNALLEEGKLKDKHLIVLLQTEDCMFCQRFREMLNKSADLKHVIRENYLLTKINVNEDPILSQILYTSSTPTILILDTAMGVKYVHTGLLAEQQFLGTLNKIKEGKSVLSYVRTSLYTSGQELYDFYSKILKAYHLNNKVFPERKYNLKAIKLLEETLQVEPYFMNQYLLMNAYYAVSEKGKADQIYKDLSTTMHEYDYILYNNLVEKKVKDEFQHIPDDQRAVFYTEKDIIEMEGVKRDIPAEFLIEYTNKGEMPLIITKVDASCGCIKSEWDRNPLLKGRKGKIKLTYLSNSQGYISKRILIYSNSKKNPVIIALKGTVK